MFDLKDERFLPVDKREPVDDYDDYEEESTDDEQLLFGEPSDAEGIDGHHGLKKTTLYVAS